MPTALVETMARDTAGLTLTTGDEIALESTRHLFLAANLLDPARSRDIGLVGGGEELDNPCMFRTRGLLPRCEITPMELWGKPMPKELFPDGQRALILKGIEQEDTSINRRFLVQGAPLYFVPMYPGEMVVDALGVASGERRGIVEVEVLRGVDYGGADREFQNLFFPADYVKPIELRLVREHIEQVAESVADPDAHSVAGDFIRSCDESGEYMGQIVSVAVSQLNQRVIQGPGYYYTYRMTPKIRSFMDQLEVKPPAEAQPVAAEDILKAVSGSGITPEVLESIMARSDERFSALLREALAAQKAQTPEVAPPAE